MTADILGEATATFPMGRLAARDLPVKRDRRQPDEEAWPRLSETLTGPVHPHFCQCCGRSRSDIEAAGEVLTAWREHGQDGKRDPQEGIFVMICGGCNKKPKKRGTKRMIDAHPRLYDDLPKNAPILGIMDLCLECNWRDGTHCANRSEKCIEYSKPELYLITCSPRSLSRCITVYAHPPRACSGREQVEAIADFTEPAEGETGS